MRFFFFINNEFILDCSFNISRAFKNSVAFGCFQFSRSRCSVYILSKRWTWFTLTFDLQVHLNSVDQVIFVIRFGESLRTFSPVKKVVKKAKEQLVLPEVLLCLPLSIPSMFLFLNCWHLAVRQLQQFPNDIIKAVTHIFNSQSLTTPCI